MSERTCLAIVLAAGEGTRMRSPRPKVLHAGRRALAAGACARCGRRAGGTAAAVVVGPDADAVAAEAKQVLPEAEIFVQAERRGTAHAVLAARGAHRARARRCPRHLRRHAADPAADADAHARGAGGRRGRRRCSASGRRIRPATGGWCSKRNELVAIREELDATPQERAIGLCNGGLMAFAGKTALAILDRIGNDNGKGEFYLTDAVTIARAMELKAAVIETEEDDVRGINTKAQLAEAEAVLQQRLRQAAMEAGRHAGRAGDGVSGGRHQIRPRRDGRALRGVRPRRDGRGQRGDPLVLASRRRACRQGRAGRSLRAAAAGRAARRGRAHRQFRRGQGGRDRGRRQGQSPGLYRRRAARRRREHRRRHDHLQLRRRRPSTAPTSARAPSSARTRRWSRR